VFNKYLQIGFRSRCGLTLLFQRSLQLIDLLKARTVPIKLDLQIPPDRRQVISRLRQLILRLRQFNL
jgi:hypothetical protein